ncbi:hypothetical protein A8B77_13340 [Erythrobacter sp. EhN03]|nr:hypothetical protein A8B77_13340 [Erythrobacter sp. EhN03]
MRTDVCGIEGGFVFRSRIRGFVLEAVPSSLRSCGPLRARVQVAFGQLRLRLRFRPCRASAGPDLAQLGEGVLVPSRRRGKADRPPELMRGSQGGRMSAARRLRV